MKKHVFLFVLGILLFVVSDFAAAQDVYVNGYYRKDGTYVAPHYRSAPDSSTDNNYGPSQNAYQRKNPYARDYDHDGTPNRYDYDSDNDGIGDSHDRNPYGKSNSNPYIHNPYLKNPYLKNPYGDQD